MTKRIRKDCSLQEDVEKVNNSFVELDTREGVNDGFPRVGPNDSLLPGLFDDVALNCLAWVNRSDYASLACINKRYNLLIRSGYLFELRKKLGIVELEHLVYLVCDQRGLGVFVSLDNLFCCLCFMMYFGPYLMYIVYWLNVGHAE